MHDSAAQGFTITGDQDGRWPLVLTSPHSGREYPAGFLAMSRLPLKDLRRAEDGFVDALLDGVAGVPVLRARYGRAWLDLNRGEEELDPAMFEGPLGLPHRHGERVAAGLGVIPRVAAQGMDIYARRLSEAEVHARLRTVHRPWHTTIAGLLARARARHGHAVLIDCHSMPSPGGVRPPQVVLGDRHGTAASAALVAVMEDWFTSQGWRVARNAPYAGGHTTVLHGRPGLGIHAVQVELDRALYMDAQRMVRHGGFPGVARAMTGMVRHVLAALPDLDLTPDWREAAE